MKKRILNTLMLLFVGASLFAQSNVKLVINHFLGDKPFLLKVDAKNDVGNNYQVTRLEYYISGIKIIHDSGKIATMPNLYILQNAESLDTVSLGNFDITNIEAINFCIGVDAKVNHNDPSKWSFSHPLSPKNPTMHWGWEPGYKFVAIEGITGPTLTQKFAIHALGDKNYFETSIPIKALQLNNSQVIVLNADYNKSIMQMNLESGIFNHGEDGTAADMLRNFQTQVFTNAQGEGNLLSTSKELIKSGVKLYPNPSTGNVQIAVTSVSLKNCSYSLTDITGKHIQSGKYLPSEFNLSTKGIYILTMQNEHFVSSEKLIIQ
jgi:hypothetical protein